jgi:hypothetical protein
MPELLVPLGSAPDGVDTPADSAAVAPEPVIEQGTEDEQPVLITEQEVLFGTAATVHRAKTRRGWLARVFLRGASVTSSEEGQPKKRHYPPRNDFFLEDSRMAREMLRL